MNFVYLDAHGHKYLPLRDELSVIVNWRNTVIMIDDFKVPFDKRFAWDKYDEEREICMPYVEHSIGSRALYFPNYPAEQEGLRIARGYCVIAISNATRRYWMKCGCSDALNERADLSRSGDQGRVKPSENRDGLYRTDAIHYGLNR